MKVRDIVSIEDTPCVKNTVASAAHEPAPRNQKLKLKSVEDCVENSCMTNVTFTINPPRSRQLFFVGLLLTDVITISNIAVSILACFG